MYRMGMNLRTDLPAGYSYRQAEPDSQLQLYLCADTGELLVNISKLAGDLSHVSVTHPLTIESVAAMRDYLTSILTD